MIAERDFGRRKWRKSSEIEGEIDEARREIDHTIEELSGRFHPKAWVSGLAEWFADRVRQTSREDLREMGVRTKERVVTTVRENPIPLALMAASLVWIGSRAYLSSDTGERQSGKLRARTNRAVRKMRERASGMAEELEMKTRTVRRRVAHQAEEISHAVGDRTAPLRHNLADRLHGIRETKPGKVFGDASERVGHAAEAVQQSLKETTHKVQQAGQESIDLLRRQAVRLEERFESGTQNYPLVTGLGFLALGLAAAIALPRTRQENEALGSAARDVRHRMRWESARLIDKGKEAAQAAVDSAGQRVRSDEKTSPPSTM